MVVNENDWVKIKIYNVVFRQKLEVFIICFMKVMRNILFYLVQTPQIF